MQSEPPEPSVTSSSSYHDSDSDDELELEKAIEHARARASDVFNNAVVLQTVFEMSDKPTRSCLLCVSTSSFDRLKSSMWREIRLTDYERMRESWPPRERLFAYTNAVRVVDISGQLPALAHRFLDVWRVFSLFPDSKRVEWSHGRLDKGGLQVDKYHFHRIIELTKSNFNRVPHSSIPGIKVYSFPSSAPFHDSRLDSFSQDLICSFIPSGTCAWTDKEGISRLSTDYGNDDQGFMGRPFARVDTVTDIALMERVERNSADTCHSLSLRPARWCDDFLAIEYVANHFPSLIRLELKPDDDRQWRMYDVRLTDWSEFASLRRLTLTTDLAVYRKDRPRSVRPEITERIPATGGGYDARDFRRVPALDRLDLIIRIKHNRAQAICDLIEDMPSVCGLLLGIGGEECSFDLKVEYLRHGRFVPLSSGIVQRTLRHTLDRLTRNDQPGWSHIADVSRV